MEFNTTSSSILVQTRLINMIRNGTVSDARIREQINAYFVANPSAGDGAGTYYVYDRNSIVAPSWIIDHNLNRFPQITLIDDEGYEFDADIFYNSLNQVTVIFSEPTSGKAVLI
jgi:hypothetical protein